MSAALEDIKSIDIEEWLTLATAPSPTKLKPGQSPAAENVWVDEKPGSVITAPGYVKLGTLPSGNPGTFCIDYFKTSTGTQTFVVSDNSTVWTTVDFQAFTSIITGLSSVYQLRGAVIRDKLWLTNGTDAVRTFDGATVVVLDGNAGTPTVPKSRYIAYHDERVWLYHQPSNRSLVSFSALADTSAVVIDPDNASAWPSSNSLQISQGDADFGTGMMLYRGYLYFTKQYSIWRLVGYDEYTYARVKCRASSGTRFNESMQIVDSLVHFIGVDGIYVFDGEETEGISDIVDPATASQGSFGFNQLQQPNRNNSFWETTTTADWNLGTIPTNLSVANQLSEIGADDSAADFQAGTLTDTDATTNPGVLQLGLVASGGGSTNVSQGKSSSLSTGSAVSQIGQASFINDGGTSQAVGFFNSADGNDMYWQIDLGGTFAIGQVVINGLAFSNYPFNGFFFAFARIEALISGVWTTVSTITLPGTTADPAHPGGVVIAPTNFTLNFNTVTATQVRLRWNGNKGNYTILEMSVFQAGFKPTGSFTSKTLDLGDTPNSLGNFNVSYALNGGTLTFYTQSSADGSSWDARVAVAVGGAIASTVRRYLRWQADFTYGAGGVTSPTIDTVWLLGFYESVIHNTGGSIFAWGAYEADYDGQGHGVNFYYRTATTSGGVSAATWRLIVPGAVISDPVANQYIQFKIEMPNADILNGGLRQPVIRSVTINWIVGTGVQSQTLQNVASYVWRNRYWLSAASAGASANDTLLIRGKKTFGSPWQLKDWNILAMTRFQDNFVGLSSTNGDILQLDSGYSKAGSAMDSYFQTGDFLFGGFYARFSEILVEVERTGSYSLTVGYSIDRGVTWTDLSVDLTVGTKPLSYMKRLNITKLTDRIRFRVRVNGTDQPFEVHRLMAFYTLEPARGSLN